MKVFVYKRFLNGKLSKHPRFIIESASVQEAQDVFNQVQFDKGHKSERWTYEFRDAKAKDGEYQIGVDPSVGKDNTAVQVVEVETVKGNV